jgi:hypothetical protein
MNPISADQGDVATELFEEFTDDALLELEAAEEREAVELPEAA